MPKKTVQNQKKVGVCMTPALIEQFDIANSIVVVIDVLRATTSMCVAIDNGAVCMRPVLNVEECRKWRAEGYLIAAERNGEQIEGFDFGNSPYSYMGPEIKGKKIAISTTNGTRALNAARNLNAKEIVIGSFANISILTEYLKERNEHVVLLCAGWKDRPNLEDTIFAGAMVRKLVGRKPTGQFGYYEDTAMIADALFLRANLRKNFYLRFASHYNRIVYTLQIQNDVKYALRRDTHSVIPILVGDLLVKMDGRTVPTVDHSDLDDE